MKRVNMVAEIHENAWKMHKEHLLRISMFQKSGEARFSQEQKTTLGGH